MLCHSPLPPHTPDTPDTMLRRSAARCYSTKLGKTFGEFQTESAGADKDGSLITKIKENNVYKNFFQSFEKMKKDSENKARITSFEEQKSFKQVFDYLSKESNKIGVVKSLETFVNFQSPLQQQQQQQQSAEDPNVSSKLSFFSTASGPINLETQYKNKAEARKKFIEALSPTLKYINTDIQKSSQMFDYVKINIIEAFLQNLNAKSGKAKTGSSTGLGRKGNKMRCSIEEIKQQSTSTPQHPVVDIQTLPILLKFCLNSLTFDFNSISTSLLLIDYIKNHESIELYGFGLNIDCYNAILIQVWSKTENLNMVGSLIDELKINAIQPDLYTFKILAKIYLHCMRVNDGLGSEPYIIWNDSSNVHKIRDYLQDFRLL